MGKTIKLYSAFFLILLISGCNRGQVSEKLPGSNITSPEKSEDLSLFFQAALEGNTETVRSYIEGGTNVNLTDEENRTALMYASFNGNQAIVSFLIENGANVNMFDVNKKTALIMAASGPYAETVRLLLENKADPNFTDLPENFTALMYAASEGQLEVVKVLLEYKADPSMKDVDGDNALTFAFNNGHTAVAELLKMVTK